ncbi:MAG: HAD family phosphatase [Ruminococcaceae bacterium]|nr:HAD family phosphatase [Oscillospiraceae bacterium]
MFRVIFDMDGTLLDTQRICVPAWDWAGEKQGILGAGKHIKEVCGMNEAGWNKLLKDNYPSIDTDKFNNDVREYVKANLVIKFKKGAEELIEFLIKNNVKIALASGSSRRSVEHHLGELDAMKYFDAILAGSDVKHGKPAPDIFLETAKRLGAEPKDCFVFEDSSNGIKAAVAAGMKCIGVPDMVEFSDEIKQTLFAEITSLDKAIDILKEYL